MILDNNILFCNRCYHTWKKRKATVPKFCPNCKSPYWNKKRKKKVVMKKLIMKMEEEIINFHDNIIKFSGGEMGIRDSGGIQLAITKLLNSSYKNRKNPTKIGSLILDDFAKKHYFMDGNKRTAYFVSKVFMLINGCHLKTKYLEALNFILEVAKYESTVSREEIKKWLDDRCVVIDKSDIERYLKDFLVDMVLEKEEWVN